MSLENRKKRKEKKSYCCDSYTSLDYVLRNSLAPTVEDLIGVLYEVAVKNQTCCYEENLQKVLGVN